MTRPWRTLDAQVRQYYSLLLNGVPQELVDVLRRLSNHEAPNEEPKIDRVRPGGMPNVRMPEPPRQRR